MKRSNQPESGRPVTDTERAMLARYRVFALPTIDRQIAAMKSILAHRLVFLINGDAASVTAAGRAFVQDAAILALMPAANLREAHGKTTFLQEQVERWIRQTAPEDAHEAALGMIVAGIAEERTRWGLTDTEPHLH